MAEWRSSEPQGQNGRRAGTKSCETRVIFVIMFYLVAALCREHGHRDASVARGGLGLGFRVFTCQMSNIVSTHCDEHNITSRPRGEIGNGKSARPERRRHTYSKFEVAIINKLFESLPR